MIRPGSHHPTLRQRVYASAPAHLAGTAVSIRLGKERRVFRTYAIVAAGLILAVTGCGDDDDDGPTGPSTGSIEVSVTSTGEPADPTGYTVAVDGGSGQSIPAGGTITISDVSAGPHTITLGDVAENCSPAAGTNPQTVTVDAGETTEVAFDVTCAAIESPPAITSVTFPATVSNDPGTSVDLTIGFTDPDGDVAILRYEEGFDPNNAGTIDPDTEDVRTLAGGRTSGTFTIEGAYTCADPDGCVTGPVTVRLRLRDEAGQESESNDLSFEIVD